MIRVTFMCRECFDTAQKPWLYGWSRWGLRWVCPTCLIIERVTKRYKEEVGPL